MSQDRCNKDDFGVFLGLWNDSQNQTTPLMHYRIAIWLQKCWALGHRRLLLQAFRASGKSTLVGIFCAWMLWRDPDMRILVLSAESALAEKMVRAVRKVIERHPLTKHLKPDNPDQWSSDSFTICRNTVSRDPSVLGRGLYANLTGARADMIVCDDVEVPNTCDTADKREKLRERLAENDFILTPGGLMLYIGTPHNYYSIYALRARKEIGEAKAFLQGYKRLSVPILDKNGESAWPERYPREAIDELRASSGPSRFSSQMMLQPVNLSSARFDVGLLKRYDSDLHYTEAQRNMVLSLNGRKLLSASAWWDPAFGTGSGDSSVLAVVFTDEKGEVYLHRVSYITVKAGQDEDEATLQCRRIAEIVRELYIPHIHIETNGIGKFLPAILRRVLGDARLPCTVTGKASSKNKQMRILESFETLMASRSLNVHASVYKTPFITEMAEWRPDAKGARDDGLDAAAGAIGLEPERLPRSSYRGGKIWSGTGNGHTAITDFDV